MQKKRLADLFQASLCFFKKFCMGQKQLVSALFLIYLDIPQLRHLTKKTV